MSNKVRIKYWYQGEEHLSGMMLLHDALAKLAIYRNQYGKAEVVNFGEKD